ncbi:MAG: RNA polymerase sigma factor [Proteobacteria bacterium]|nr:RNA polymerase sigma factor [Pseudomonadota bacterium]
MQTPTQEAVRQAEFTKFMRTYQNMVFSTAARLSGNDAQAEDIAQEVFLRAHRRFDELRDNPRAAGWLKTVATNLTFTHLTRYRKRWVFFSQLQGADDADDEPAIDFAAEESVVENVREDERHEYVEAALRELPEHQRVPLVLYHFEDMPYEDIAQRLKVSLAKVKTDIHRARAALATILERRGITAEQLEA